MYICSYNKDCTPTQVFPFVVADYTSASLRVALFDKGVICKEGQRIGLKSLIRQKN